MLLRCNHVEVHYPASQKNLSYHFQWELPTHGFSVLQGESGCGKSTLLQCVAGFSPLSSGVVEGVHQKEIAFLFQESRLFPWRTVSQHIKDVTPPKKPPIPPQPYLDWVGLTAESHLKPHSLSGGMQRRLALARTLAYGEAIGATLYLLDEPFTGMDVALIDQFLPRLQQLPVPVLIATHAPHVVAQAQHCFSLDNHDTTTLAKG